MAASFKLRLSFILIIFHLSDQFVATRPISYKYKIESCKDFAGLLEDGLLLRKYWHSCVIHIKLSNANIAKEPSIDVHY